MIVRKMFTCVREDSRNHEQHTNSLHQPSCNMDREKFRETSIEMIEKRNNHIDCSFTTSIPARYR